ncbi:MAG: NUDIX domain-containing protein [Clostridia bacterium]|nr:NUDIX domain-containing protein [Clostridia bacterium]
MIIKFYDNVNESIIKFAVIAAKSDGMWVLCKHGERESYEFPGGHRELGESPIEAAKRELYEETGAIDFSIKTICYYSVRDKRSFNGDETFGLLCYADIAKFENALHSEIESILVTETLPDNWTYPEIQLKLFDELSNRGII